MYKYDKAKMVDDLKQMRLDAGMSQKALGQRIGLSRETIVAIENKYPGAIATLEMDTVKLWFRACKSNADPSILLRFKNGLMAFFGV